MAYFSFHASISKFSRVYFKVMDGRRRRPYRGHRYASLRLRGGGGGGGGGRRYEKIENATTTLQSVALPNGTVCIPSMDTCLPPSIQCLKDPKMKIVKLATSVDLRPPHLDLHCFPSCQNSKYDVA